MNYDYFITSRRSKYRSQSLLFCVIRCPRSLCLPNRCLANKLPFPAFMRYLSKRCLATDYSVIILWQLSRCVERHHSLDNGLLEALRKHERPLLINGCRDTSLRDNSRSQMLRKMFSVQLEKNYLKRQTFDRQTDRQSRGEIQPDCGRWKKSKRGRRVITESFGCYNCSELRSVTVTARLKVLQLIVIPLLSIQ
jgi:hypothetical protein